MGYRRPGVGAKRKQLHPLVVDRMPLPVREAIQTARAGGRTWAETTEAAAAAAALLKVQSPSETAVRRWYDLRVEQVQREVMKQADSAQRIAAAFASKGFDKLPEATVNALSAEVFALTEAAAPAQRQKALGGLLFLLSKLMTAQTGQKKLELERDKLSLAERRLEQMRAKLGGLKNAVSGKKKLSPAEMQKALDEIYGIAQK